MKKNIRSLIPYDPSTGVVVLSVDGGYHGGSNRVLYDWKEPELFADTFEYQDFHSRDYEGTIYLRSTTFDHRISLPLSEFLKAMVAEGVQQGGFIISDKWKYFRNGPNVFLRYAG